MRLDIILRSGLPLLQLLHDRLVFKHGHRLLLCCILSIAPLRLDLDYEVSGRVLHEALYEDCLVMTLLANEVLRHRLLAFFILRGRDEHNLGGWMLDGIETS